MLLVSFNAHMCVGDQECIIPHSTMAIAGGKASHIWLNPTAANLPPLLLAVAVTAAAAVVMQASFRFPSLIACNDLNLCEKFGRGSLQSR